MVTGESIVRMNVAIRDQIARFVKRKMEYASSVNQDIGVTTVEVSLVMGMQGILRSLTQCVRHI